MQTMGPGQSGCRWRGVLDSSGRPALAVVDACSCVCVCVFFIKAKLGVGDVILESPLIATSMMSS